MKKLPHMIALLWCLGTPVLSTAGNTDAIDRAYIEGFLAGAQLTDSEILTRLEDARPDEKYSDFFKRAFETRIGSAKEPIPATFYAGFCLPENLTGDQVVTQILKEINSTEGLSGSEKANRIFQAVRSKYPCQ